jgi:signal transduction histidine kinase
MADRLPGAAAARRGGGAAGLIPRLRVGQWLGLTIGVLLILAVIGIGLALAANSRLTDRRNLLLDRIGPARLAALDLGNALVNQETGVRGFIIDGRPQFLQPYRLGLIAQEGDFRQLRSLLRASAAAYRMDADLVQSAAVTWQRGYVAPVLRGRHSTPPLDAKGKALFDAVRRSLARLQAALNERDSKARAELVGAGSSLRDVLLVAGALIVLGLIAAAALLRLIVTAPLVALGREARRVSGGDFDTPLAVQGGAREIVSVRADVDAMREIIVGELVAASTARTLLQEQAIELERSNAELEQFAYVASHDLQEPLRKVASFCQALEQRYEGQLDERADQYIHFAVDGAKRMQILINDLLAFSRVGRGDRAHERLDLSELAAEARSSLSRAIDEAGATLVVAELPVVRGDRTLLVSVFANLIANAIKFRGPEPPVIRIDAHRADGYWELSCTDNGIGIDREYAERIFVIFQRLHGKESYPGTGIGLAMSRKIIEHHGGRIWLDTDYRNGSRIRFTVPISEEIQP